MLGLPKDTESDKQISKKALLMNAPSLKTKERDAFYDAIQSIKVVNAITPNNVAVAEGKGVKAIFVFEVILKTCELPLHSIELIFQLIPWNIILLLKYEEEEMLAIKCQKIFFTEWSKSGYSLEIEGLNFDTVWANFVSMISGITPREGETIDEAVRREIRNEEIRKSILSLEKEMKRIKTKTKQFDIYNKILALKEQLD